MIPLQIFTGSVNFTNFLHVTAAKVANPTQIVWETWIPEPQATYNFIIPIPDQDTYYITFYEALTNTAIGLLVSQAVVAVTSSTSKHDILFYEFGNLPSTASLDSTSTILTDTYLIGKNIESYFKEGFRFLQPGSEITFDNTTGAITILNGVVFSPKEKLTIGIAYTSDNTSSSSSVSGGGLYTGTSTIIAQTAALGINDKNKRIRLQGTAATQIITLPALFSISDDDGFYFDNTCGGVAIQPKLLFNGSDSIKYNGFFTATNFFQEFWVSKGEHLLIRKFTDGSTPFYEVITDYKGVNVGKRMSGQINTQPGYIPEDSTLYNGDEYGRLWWYINNKLSATQVLIDDSVINSGYVQPTNTRPGQFVKHSTLKQFRVPNTQGLSEKGLYNFNFFGTDTANRPYDYPGGFQDAQVGQFSIDIPKGNGYGGDNQSPGRFAPGLNGNVQPTDTIVGNTGFENRIKNTGVIYSVHI